MTSRVEGPVDQHPEQGEQGKKGKKCREMGLKTKQQK